MPCSSGIVHSIFNRHTHPAHQLCPLSCSHLAPASCQASSHPPTLRPCYRHWGMGWRGACHMTPIAVVGWIPGAYRCPSSEVVCCALAYIWQPNLCVFHSSYLCVANMYIYYWDTPLCMTNMQSLMFSHSLNQQHKTTTTTRRTTTPANRTTTTTMAKTTTTKC